VKFDLKRPCPHCPFRRGMGYLTGERAEGIARAVAGGGTFACHQTTVPVEDDEGFGDLTEGPDSQMCAGAMIAMMREDAPNQIMRIAERTGVLDIAALDMNADVGTLLEFVREHAGEDEVEHEPCGVVNYGCLAPAGYLEGGSVIPAMDREETFCCAWCGDYVCDNCSKVVDDEIVCEFHEDGEYE
jgi:hypothetical protein